MFGALPEDPASGDLEHDAEDGEREKNLGWGDLTLAGDQKR